MAGCLLATVAYASDESLWRWAYPITWALSVIFSAGAVLGMIRFSLKKILKDIDRHEKRLSDITEDLAEVSRDRFRCELRASGQFATRTEIARLISDSMYQMNRIHDSISGVHKRMDHLTSAVGRLEGKSNG